LGLNLGLLFVFIQFTKLHELLVLILHVNTFILYFVGIPAYFALIAGGGLRRTWQWPQARYWIALTFWLFMAVPTSLWIVNSLSVAMVYARTEIFVLFLIVAFVLTWRDFQRLLTVLAASAVVNVLAGRFLQLDNGDRLQLAGGTMADPNDFAALLILMLPFLLLVVMSPGSNLLKKGFSVAVMIAGLYMILSTGSRGAVVGLAAAILYALYRLDMARRIMALACIGVVLASLTFALPAATAKRLASIFSSSANADDFDEVSAFESKVARTYLLRKSVAAALHHPVFGVGEEQFQNYEGAESRAAGRQGVWHEAHNTYTQIASETGLPGFLFLFGGLVATFRLLIRTYRKARSMPPTPQNRKICAACFCIMTSLIGFSVTIFFLSMAYRFYLPAFAGIAIALTRAAEQEWSVPAAPST
jgi:O-antigen ligase